MPSQSNIFDSVVLTPTGVGVIMLLIATLFARRPLTFGIVCVVAVGLHHVTIAYLRAWDGFFGGAVQRNNVTDEFCGIGFAIIGGLIALKFGIELFLAKRARKHRSPSDPRARYDY